MIRRVDGWRRGDISLEDYQAAIKAGGKPTDPVEIPVAKAAAAERPTKPRSIKRSTNVGIEVVGEGVESI